MALLSDLQLSLLLQPNLSPALNLQSLQLLSNLNQLGLNADLLKLKQLELNQNLGLGLNQLGLNQNLGLGLNGLNQLGLLNLLLAQNAALLNQQKSLATPYGLHPLLSTTLA